MSRKRVAKPRFTTKARRAVCACKAQNGAPKTLYSQHWMASKSAGDILGPQGKMWEIYKCRSGGAGFHIATVRSDPWKNFDFPSQTAAS